MADNEQQYLKARELHRAGKLAEAEPIYLQILAATPGHFQALRLMGMLRAQQGRGPEGLQLIERALSVNARSADAHFNHGAVLKMQGRFIEALESHNRSLALVAGDTDVLGSRASVLESLGRPEEALADYSAALAQKPDSFEMRNNRGVMLMALKCYGPALEDFDAVLAVQPDSVTALINRGMALRHLNRLEEAIASFDAALMQQPRDAMLLGDRADVLASLGLFDAANAGFSAALAIEPDNAELWFERANARWFSGRTDEAVADFKKALALNPNHAYAFGGLANAAMVACDWAAMGEIGAQIFDRLKAGKPGMLPGVMLGYGDSPGLLLRGAQIYARDRAGKATAQRPACKVTGNERLKIAYLSPDFQQHATAYLIADLIERHDRSRFEVFGLSLGADDGGDMRRRLSAAFEHFHDFQRSGDDDIAAMLRQNNVAIAVDLNGPMRGARPGILAGRPCPVQVSYLGFPGTTGADFMDYVIADRIVAPFEHQAFFSEKIVHLPHCYQANDSRRTAGAALPSRAAAGLPEEGFVFCCFNVSWKITPPLFDIWMRLLQAVQGSVLWLLEDREPQKKRLRREAERRGVDGKRIIFAPRAMPDEHLARHRLADLFLDTLPYNAHTTASDALRMGLPLITCPGSAFQSRVAASLLETAGLPELITSSLEAYETLALELARDPQKLEAMRARLTNVHASPLFNTDLLRRHIEKAYTTMADIARRGEAPRSFAVDAEAG